MPELGWIFCSLLYVDDLPFSWSTSYYVDTKCSLLLLCFFSCLLQYLLLLSVLPAHVMSNSHFTEWLTHSLCKFSMTGTFLSTSGKATSSGWLLVSSASVSFLALLPSLRTCLTSGWYFLSVVYPISSFKSSLSWIALSAFRGLVPADY